MTDQPEVRDPRLAAALDRSLPFAERQRQYIAWAESMTWHVHPRWPTALTHGHPGGDQLHDHREEKP